MKNDQQPACDPVFLSKTFSQEDIHAMKAERDAEQPQQSCVAKSTASHAWRLLKSPRSWVRCPGCSTRKTI
jgi:hypothetical protein